MNKTCPICNSEKYITNLKISDYGHMHHKKDLSIEIDTTPNNLINKGTRNHIILSDVCCNCGKVELHIENPEELWDEYQNESK